MEHIKALAIKGIMTIIILYLILGLGFRFTFGDVFADDHCAGGRFLLYGRPVRASEME